MVDGGKHDGYRSLHQRCTSNGPHAHRRSDRKRNRQARLEQYPDDAEFIGMGSSTGSSHIQRWYSAHAGLHCLGRHHHSALLSPVVHLIHLSSPCSTSVHVSTLHCCVREEAIMCHI